MSQTQPEAGFQAIQDAIRELMSEIAFQRVLLSSIDDSVEDREAAEDEVRTEIRNLQSELAALKRGSKSSTAEPDPYSPDPHEAEAASDVNSSTPVSNNDIDDIPTCLASLDQHTSNSLGSFPELLSPSKMSLPTRKRSHSKHLDGLAPVTDNKSRRTSPGPFLSHPSTPSSASGDDEFRAFDSDFYNLQRTEEKRIEREKKDEDLARSMNCPARPLNRPPPSTSGRSAFDRMSGMQPPPASSSSRMASSSTGQPSSSTFLASSYPRSGVQPARAVPSKIKGEPSNYSTALPRPKKRSLPWGVQGSCDSDDSDIEIISASEFNSSSRSPPTPVTAPRYVAQSSTKSALHLAMYGAKGVPALMTTNPRTPSNLASSPQVNGNGYRAGTPGSIGTGYHGYSRYSGYNMHNQLPGIGNGMHNMNSSLPSTINLFGAATMPRTATNSDSMGPPFPSANFDDEMFGPFNSPYNERLAGQLDYIMNDPRKTNEEIKALIENIRPDEDLPAENREGTPEGLKYPLYEHQKLALTWLKTMEESSNKGAILADDMGLGKTLQAIALILSRPSTDRLRKTTLIVGPVALVRQWEREIHKKIKPEYRLSTYMAHGGRRLPWDELRNYDIVLTSYNTLAAEFKRWVKFLEQQHAAGRLLERDIDEGPLRKMFPLLGPKSLFYRVILDEAQCIKNKSTVAARAAYHLKSITRLCLTGTPMMNNVGELFSLIHFLRIRPYSDFKTFQADFGMLTKGNGSQSQLDKAMRKLQALLKAILLRRMKTSLIDGKPLITLPPKTEEVTHVVFSEDEQAFYNALEGKSRIQFNKYMRANTVGKNYSNILVLLLRLRQCCCHPHLITDFEDGSSAGATNLTADAMAQLAEGLTPDIVNRLLAAESFECPVCYDAVENPVIFTICGHDTCSECLTKISDQANQQNVVNGDDAVGTFKCPSCRAKIESNKIIDYTTFKKVHMKDQSASEDINDTARRDGDSDGDSTESESDNEIDSVDEVNANGDLRNFIVPDDIEDEGEDDEKEEEKEEEGRGDAQSLPKKKATCKGKRKESRGKGKEKRKDEKPCRKHLSIAMLKKEASKSAKGRSRYMRYLRKHWQPSAKVSKCMELLDQFQAADQKTIVFSQFVSLLDLLQVPISEKGWECERYDGSMSADARNDAINRFTDRSNTKIMLISLKAGNAGLNLVAASRVIILDPFWNPFIEMQAVDRAYRIGQQRPVEVHRILIQKTVEDRIIELQERKKRLVDEALSEGASKSLGRLGVRELAFLFGVEGNS